MLDNSKGSQGNELASVARNSSLTAGLLANNQNSDILQNHGENSIESGIISTTFLDQIIKYNDVYFWNCLMGNVPPEKLKESIGRNYWKHWILFIQYSLYVSFLPLIVIQCITLFDGAISLTNIGDLVFGFGQIAQVIVICVSLGYFSAELKREQYMDIQLYSEAFTYSLKKVKRISCFWVRFSLHHYFVLLH